MLSMFTSTGWLGSRAAATISWSPFCGLLSGSSEMTGPLQDLGSTITRYEGLKLEATVSTKHGDVLSKKNQTLRRSLVMQVYITKQSSKKTSKILAYVLLIYYIWTSNLLCDSGTRGDRRNFCLPGSWLNLREDERVILIRAYSRNVKIPGPTECVTMPIKSISKSFVSYSLRKSAL
jgi:hypothetical protein